MDHRLITLACLLTLLGAPQVTAQTSERPNANSAGEMVALAGRHQVSLSLGFMGSWANRARITAGESTLEAKSSLTGWLGYGFWLDDEWALQVELGWIHSDAEISAGGAETAIQAATVVPLLLGVRYQPAALAIGSAARVYLAALVGPYVGSSSRVGAFPAALEAHTDQAVGARLGAGVDVLPGGRFRIGMAARYHAVADFDQPIGARDNYSGFELALKLGFLLGGGR